MNFTDYLSDGFDRLGDLLPLAAVTGVHISPTMYFAPIYVVVTSVLMAGFLGSIRDGIETGRYDFAYNARTDFLPFLGYSVLV